MASTEQPVSENFTLRHSISQVKKAGERIRKGRQTDSDITVVQNYRAAHLAPMERLSVVLNEITQRYKRPCIVASRLKKLPTILDKLQRVTLSTLDSGPTTLSRLSDIAGCRVIVLDLGALAELFRDLEAICIPGVRLKKLNDYLQNSKVTGYRGLHLIYECEVLDFDGKSRTLDVEVQLRTRGQHLWAAAIELLDLCEGTKLKTAPLDANPELLRYFYVVSELFAQQEGIIDLSEAVLHEYNCEFVRLESKLNIIERITLPVMLPVFINKNPEILSTDYVVICPIKEKGQVEVFTSTEDEKFKAIEYYQEKESEGREAVMVNVSDYKKIADAYPAYMLHADSFSKILNEIKNKHGISSQAINT